MNYLSWGLLLLSLIALMISISSKQKVNSVLRTALRNADAYKPGGRETVVIPYNQLAELMGWKSDNFPMREDSSFCKPKHNTQTFKGAPRRRKG